MDVEFADKKLLRLYSETGYSAGFPPEVERGYRKVVGLIRNAEHERALAAFVGLRMEKLKGDRAHQRSLRINGQWRLIVELRAREDDKLVVIIEIVDYH